MRFAVALAVAALLLLSGFGNAEQAQQAEQTAEIDAETILENVDLSPLEEWAGEIDIKEMILSIASGEANWDMDQLLSSARDALLGEFFDALKMLAGLILPVLLAAAIDQVAGDARGAQAVGQVCFLVCALQLMRWFFSLVAGAEELILRVAGISDALFPILSTILGLTGATASAAMLSPLAALAGHAFSELLNGVALKLTGIAAILAVAGNLSPKIRLDRLFSLVRSVVNWLTGVLMTAFLGVVSMKNLLAASYDSAAVRTARYAVDNLLPVIGGEVANTMDALVSSILLTKNAVGVTGVAVLIGACARPLLELVAALAVLRLASALIEPLGADAILRLTDRFSQVAGMLTVVCASGMVILLLLLGGALMAGAGIVR